MKLFEVSFEPSIEAACSAAIDAFKRARQFQRWTTFRGPEGVENSLVFELRDWGQWIVPQGEEDDGDYDWKQPSEETSDACMMIIQQLKKKYPKFEFGIEPSEKNWFSVYVKPRM